MTNFDSHRKAAVSEDIEFLRDSGLSDEQIAKRLGLKVDALQKRREREANGNARKS